MYKPLADSTLQRMKKKEIIELLRIAEHNAKVAQEYVEQQAENIKDWAPVVHGRWEKQSGLYSCSECGTTCPYDVQADVIEYWACNYCPNCGAKIDGGIQNV